MDAINRILQQEDPSWFKARVVFLRKKMKRISTYANIRPITIMPIIAKIIEAIALPELKKIPLTMGSWNRS